MKNWSWHKKIEKPCDNVLKKDVEHAPSGMKKRKVVGPSGIIAAELFEFVGKG